MRLPKVEHNTACFRSLCLRPCVLSQAYVRRMLFEPFSIDLSSSVNPLPNGCKLSCAGHPNGLLANANYSVPSPLVSTNATIASVTTARLRL
jgi:hypothetical protein